MDEDELDEILIASSLREKIDRKIYNETLERIQRGECVQIALEESEIEASKPKKRLIPMGKPPPPKQPPPELAHLDKRVIDMFDFRDSDAPPPLKLPTPKLSQQKRKGNADGTTTMATVPASKTPLTRSRSDGARTDTNFDDIVHKLAAQLDDVCDLL